MKSLLVFALATGSTLFSVVPAAAQFGGRNGAPGGPAAFGAMARPLGGFSSGLNNFGASRNFNRTLPRRGFNNYPYAYSVWAPDYFDYLNGTGLYAAPSALVPDAYYDAGQTGNVQPSQQPVVINQYFSAPAEQPRAQTPDAPQPNHTNTAVPGDPLSAPQTYYLIAYKNHAIYAALAYWVEDKTLHYVTTQNTHNQASMALIDLALTKSLNQDRQVPFSISNP
ncbi:MAG: hypothetical protein M3N93_04360 [Acidobacteriota bacterium]|nr:hypothetical protein [Acidobacteriota bacterium]